LKRQNAFSLAASPAKEEASSLCPLCLCGETFFLELNNVGLGPGHFRKPPPILQHPRPMRNSMDSIQWQGISCQNQTNCLSLDHLPFRGCQKQSGRFLRFISIRCHHASPEFFPSAKLPHPFRIKSPKCFRTCVPLFYFDNFLPPGYPFIKPFLFLLIIMDFMDRSIIPLYFKEPLYWLTASPLLNPCANNFYHFYLLSVEDEFSRSFLSPITRISNYRDLFFSRPISYHLLC